MISKNNKGKRNLKKVIFKKFAEKQDGFSQIVEYGSIVVLILFFCTFIFDWDWSTIFTKFPTALGSMFDKVLNMWK